MYSLLRNQNVITNLSPISLLALIVTMTAGCMLAVWLGELISEYGISNGISFLIFAGIVARLPIVLGQSVSVIRSEDILKMLIFLVVAILVVGLIVFMNEATRRIPINYARRTGRTGLTSSYLPLRVNQAGVIPIIFAVSLVLLPSFAGQYLQGANNAKLADLGHSLVTIFNPDQLAYNLSYFLLVMIFTYFYTAVTFNPEKIADEIK